ncbi:androgen-dependent TFPI-regulating protein isoform X3 [Fukomys damarensis]|uniref:androgen-dependent TFPI-regulating protein isoform X3 n=1 Tax=Fukomys damarensis TaxID=885580 RepID=UPI00053F5AE2|nr:androgen-dependent TFPI-regulating protein isoform X3 [Fukomys damarensis]
MRALQPAEVLSCDHRRKEATGRGTVTCIEVAMTRTSTCTYHFILLNWYIFLNFYIPQLGTFFQDSAQSKYLTLLNLFVFLAFWTIFLYDRELIYPKVLDGMFPGWLNHAMHSFIFLFSLIEIILRPHHYPPRKTGLTLLAISSVGYISRILWLHSKTGQWVYPVLAKLSPLGLTAFFFLSYFLIASIYLLGERLNQWKWGDRMLPWMKME